MLRLIKKIEKYGLKKVINYIFIKLNRKLEIKVIEKNLNFLKKHKIKNFVTDMNFFYKEIYRTNILSYYEKRNGISAQILNEANEIIDHKFDLLGSGKRNLGKKINWSQDFKTGFIWPKIFYTKIKIVDLANNADVKVPWELSRFQHLFTLGKAYLISKDLKFYKEGKYQIENWIEENPVYIGVNWTCAMDVAIRAINWIFFYFQFEDLVKRDKRFLEKLNNSLYEHGQFIALNLEKELSLANNHYLSNLCGLMFLGIYFNNYKNKEVKKWLKYSKKELEKEMFIQNNNDGTNYESSTSYHRLVTELMFYSLLIGEINGIEFSYEYKKRLELMFEFLAKITKPNGKIPMIGDVDNGRLVILSKYSNWDVSDVRNTLALGGHYFENKLLKKVGGKEIEDKVWIFNSQQEYQQEYLYSSTAFPNGGYYLLRNKNIYCMIRCGELSCRGQGGHSHNDQLSIEVNVKGKDFIVDTGTGVYTSNYKIRNLFRGTKQHNTVIIDDLEQNDFNEKDLFNMNEQTFSKCINFSSDEFEGEHYGYKAKIGEVHKRKVKLKINSIEILDELVNSGKSILIFHPSAKIIENNEKIYIENKSIRIKLVIPKDKVSYISKKVSDSYGNIKNTSSLYIKVENRGGFKILC